MFRAVKAFAPTRRLAFAAALAAPVWLFSGGTRGLIVAGVVAGMLFVLVLVDAAMSPSGRQVFVERRFPANAGIGEWIKGDYVVRSSWPRPIDVYLFDLFPPSLVRDVPGPLRFRVAPLGSAEVHVSVQANERGPHAFGPVALRVAGPLGLVQRTMRSHPTDQLLVTPSLSGIRRYRLLALQHRLRDAGVRAIRKRGQGTDFANLREYVQGDDPRYIDWKASARRGTAITREYTVEQGQTIMLAIDAGRLMTQLSGPLPRFEYALSAALVLADVAVHSRDQIGLIVFDDVVRAFVPPTRGSAALENIRSALVAARASLVEPDYAMAFRTLATRHRKRSLIVLFTDVIDSRSSQAIIAHSSRSAARHLPLVVALRNDQLMAAARPGLHPSSLALYESAAAEELVSARDEALLRMRRAGVSVLDVSPGHATAALINRYIELKARASL